MTTPSIAQQQVTQLLGDWSGGDQGALEEQVDDQAGDQGDDRTGEDHTRADHGVGAQG